MAHESFEDPEVAKVINAFTVPVKVDREERPDVDAVYMAATQATTGQGGWPMTVFATPDGDPFYCGTYFPRDHFLALVKAIGQAWSTQRADVIAQGQHIVRHLAPAPTVRGEVSPELLHAAAHHLYREHDEVHGGFGTAPKFPPAMVLMFLLRHYERTGKPESLEVVQHTCERMARGGIYDQLAGGFARYSVDAQWRVPHFEKMLYDNALLLRAYTQLWRLTGDQLAGRVARETAEFLLNDLNLSQPGSTVGRGGFAAALDADTEGVEGLTYTWTPDQLMEVLGKEDGAWAADVFGVTPQGTFERGTSVLQLSRDLDDAADEVVARWQRVRTALRNSRRSRPQPAWDDKLVAAWNGLAITALIEFAQLAPLLSNADPKVMAVATAAEKGALRAAEVLADLHVVDGRLRRVSRDGVVGTAAGTAEDYGCVAEALCAVHQFTGEGRWLSLAGQLLDVALEHFVDGEGGFYDTADDAPKLVIRPRDISDGATPSGTAALAGALTTYSALTASVEHRQAAQRAISSVAVLIQSQPRFAGWAAAVAEAHVSGPWEIALVGDSGELEAAARRHAPGGSVIVSGEPNQPGVPLLADRPLVEGAAAAYLCKGFMCDRPVTDPGELAEKLKRPEKNP